MNKRELLYEGKAKRVFATDKENIVWIEYKDSLTAFNGEKRAEILGKGKLNNEITSLLFSMLHEKGIPNHFIKKVSDNEQLAKHVTIIPLEVIVRNYTAGSFSKRFGVPEGKQLKRPIVEFCLKNDELGDPPISEEQIDVLDIATLQDIDTLRTQALKINRVLTNFFEECNLRLIDFKLEFGKDTNGHIVLADEISPDTCRLWDINTNEKLDKDVFRRDLGNLIDAYKTILHRLGGKQHV
ncbi:phosphoribosylaminoimidazolesuccinocarboxamide synthase [Bacillus andreraoultii]|uniref:phosphoribosylaminoimidazolesuccinocarboxamide synthase n=1 Tax=Bacillus andreraoultii TaxID=1499685 RepID=UPI0005396C15|nr:phosphoribosylaminoimidazolesuccinocarboxamide synthase [Bacillus andreraoultii]